MRPGIYSPRDLDIVDYHSDHSAVSKSGLVQFARTPRNYLLYTQNVKSKPESDSMRTGKALHTCVLEPDEVNHLIVKPDPAILGKGGARNTNAYKQWAAEMEAAKKIVVTDSQWEDVMRMIDSIYEDPRNLQAKELLTSGPAEMTFCWEDISHSLVKARPDKLPGAPIVVNLKTCRDASPEAFGKQAHNLNYHWSAFIDTLGTTVVTGASHFEYYLIAVENTLPYDVAVYRVTPKIMDLARRQCEPLLHDLWWCKKNNQWPGYGSDIKELQFPGYAFK